MQNSRRKLYKPSKESDVQYSEGFTLTPDWHVDAACRKFDSDVWFNVGGKDNRQHVRKAKSICNFCPVSGECLDYAISNSERYGIWGGKTPNERARLVSKHADGRMRSMYRGVYHAARDKKWKSKCTINGHLYFLGAYHTEQEAAYVYDKVVRYSHQYPKLNNVTYDEVVEACVRSGVQARNDIDYGIPEDVLSLPPAARTSRAS